MAQEQQQEKDEGGRMRDEVKAKRAGPVADNA
jgi:hypothetical protein